MFDFLRKAYSYTRSVTSGQADQETIALRASHCFAPCKDLLRTPQGNYCGACNCGIRPEAELSNKLRYAYVNCPRNKPGFQ